MRETRDIVVPEEKKTPSKERDLDPLSGET